MGAWGADSFANDDAMDWVAELEGAGDLSVVRAALDAVIVGDAEYLEATVGSIALAAAEVVAALRGRPPVGLPDEVAAWIDAHRQAPDPALVRLAAQAVEAVTADPARSELRDLWDEAADDDRAAWQAVVTDLRERLT